MTTQLLREFVLLLVLILVCGLLIFTVYSSIESRTFEDANAEQRIHALHIAADIRDFFGTYNSSLRTLGINEHILALDEDGKEMIQEFFEYHADDITGLALINHSGSVVYRYPADYAAEINQPGQPGLSAGYACRTAPVSDGCTVGTEEKILAYSVPLNLNMTSPGVICAYIPLESFKEQVLPDSSVLGAGDALVINETGIVLAATDDTLRGRKITEIYGDLSSLFATVPDSGTLSGIRYGTGRDPEDGQRYHAVLGQVEIPDTTWTILVSTRDSRILENIQDITTNLVLAFLLLVSGLFLFFYLVFWIIRESEEKYRAVVEHARESILVTRKGILKFSNSKAARLTGLSAGDPVLGLSDWIVPEDRERVLARIQAVEEGKEPSDTSEYQVRIPSGEVLWVSSHTVPVHLDKKRALIHFLSDITEHKLADLSLARALKKLNLLSDITRHDILNQLTALYGYLSVSRSETNDPVLLDYLAREEAITRTIQNQIEFTRNYQQLGVKAPEWQHVREKVQEAAQNIQLGSVTMTCTTMDLAIYADPLLVKVFYNLIENSVRYGKTITKIEWSEQEAEDGLIIFYKDNGVGIPAAEKENIFLRRFYQHSGFGMMLSREILSLTNITIRETGEPGKGVVFEIHVPKGAYRHDPPAGDE